jgi:cytochrome c
VALVSHGGLLALLGALAACSAPTPPAPATSSAPSVDARPVPPGPVTSAAPPDAAGAGEPRAAFDPGPVRTAEEYLSDPRFASADLERGQLLSLACAACHTLGPAQGTLVGPNLHGVFGRRAGAVVGFDYSPALAGSGLVWTPVSVEAWLTEPAGFIVGTKMAFTGYRSAEDRRDLIAYLLHATQ